MTKRGREGKSDKERGRERKRESDREKERVCWLALPCLVSEIN